MRGAKPANHLFRPFIFVCIICLLPVFPLAAEAASLTDLVGTWHSNSFTTGPSQPWWSRGTMTVSPNATFTFSGTENSGKVDNATGTLSISYDGFSVTIQGQLNGLTDNYQCQIDSNSRIMACTEIWSDGSSNLLVFTKQASSYSLTDLAGTWEGNFLSSGPTSGSGSVIETINSNGTFTGSYTNSDGTKKSISGAVSISSAGVITCTSGDCANPTYAAFLDSDKTVLVGTDGGATKTEEAGLFVLTKQAASYSPADLTGTWQGNGLASGPLAPWLENDTLSITSVGTYSFIWTGSNGSSGTNAGNVSISSGGNISINFNSPGAGFIDENKSVMVFADILPDGKTQEIKIFTKDVVITPNAGTTVPSTNPFDQATTDTSQAGVGGAPTTAASTSSTANDGRPAATNTAESNTGGKAAQPGGSRAAEANPANGTQNAPTAEAANNTDTGPRRAKPSKVPEAPEIVAATTGFARSEPGNAQATINFKLPPNSSSQVTKFTVTSNPGGIKATGVGSPITVSGLTNGTVYTFTVAAANEIGTGPASSASNRLTPVTVPGAPVIVEAKADNAGATISFKPPESDGGKPITGYTVTWYPSGGEDMDAGKPPTSRTHTITGLSNGTAYTFTVKATNAVGTGPASKSTSVTPGK